MRYPFSYKLSQDSKANHDAILNLLDEFGLVVIDNYIDQDTNSKLNVEFEEILSTPNTNYKNQRPYSEGRACVVTRERLGNALPTTKEVFSRKMMQGLAKSYVGDDVKFNYEIYVVNDVVGSKHVANDLHFDVTKSFKFFMYLSDTKEENGAFACVPGSHKKTEEIRARLGDNITYEDLSSSRSLPVEDHEIISIEAPEGSLIIFDTEVFHRAGHVSKGERKVMRAHCNSLEQYNKAHKRSFSQKLKSRLKKILG